MIKHYLLMTLVCIPLALLYVCLEWFFGNTWVTVGVFFGVLVVLRLGLYLYRRSKGIRDGFWTVRPTRHRGASTHAGPLRQWLRQSSAADAVAQALLAAFAW